MRSASTRPRNSSKPSDASHARAPDSVRRAQQDESAEHEIESPGLVGPVEIVAALLEAGEDRVANAGESPVEIVLEPGQEHGVGAAEDALEHQTLVRLQRPPLRGGLEQPEP